MLQHHGETEAWLENIGRKPKRRTSKKQVKEESPANQVLSEHIYSSPAPINTPCQAFHI